MWTHLKGFEHLSATELDQLVTAPARIVVLVGMSDGEIDREERVWSDRLLRSRTYNKPKSLNAFYSVVLEGFWDKVNQQIAALPDDADARNQLLSDQLADINPILSKLDPLLASDMYKGFCGLAEETAEASGGFLRIGAISKAERPWVTLPMLHPIARPANAPDPKEDWQEEDTAEEDE